MKRIALIAIAMSASILVASAQKTITCETSADVVVKLWDNATAPSSNGLSGDEYITPKGYIANTQENVLYIFKADAAKSTGRSVVIVPGGGYSQVVMRKGIALAEWMRSIGLTAAVLKYRLPNGHPEIPLEDTKEAFRYMRENAASLGIDPAKVGICGGSAGGHLAAYASTFMADEEKPSFAIIFYPVISGLDFPHQGTFKRLLGDRREDKEALAYYSLENHVTTTTPPTLLFHSDDDPQVASIHSAIYFSALKKQGVKSTMYIYPSGGHGWVGNNAFRYDKEYKAAIEDWLTTLE